MSKCVSCKNNICKVFNLDKNCNGMDMSCKFRMTSEQEKEKEENKIQRYQDKNIYATKLYDVKREESIWTVKKVFNTYAVS
jgi:hypothetical protein